MLCVWVHIHNNTLSESTWWRWWWWWWPPAKRQFGAMHQRSICPPYFTNTRAIISMIMANNVIMMIRNHSYPSVCPSVGRCPGLRRKRTTTHHCDGNRSYNRIPRRPLPFRRSLPHSTTSTAELKEPDLCPSSSADRH